jgi:hypothetical protein
MNLRPVGLVLAAALAACAAGGGAPPPDPASVLRAVATDIEALGARHAQLAAFRAADHLDLAQARIDYAWHTHAAARTGGWTSGVPAPDADGIWLYIDVHDPACGAAEGAARAPGRSRPPGPRRCGAGPGLGVDFPARGAHPGTGHAWATSTTPPAGP